MVIHIVAEDFACNVDAIEVADVITAHSRAVELSNVHNVDFVVILVDGMPMVKFVDGTEVKL